MSKNKVIFGLENVHIAFMNDNNGVITWETPQAIKGAVSFSPEPSGEQSTFYADNGPYFEVTTNNGYTADLEMALIPDEIMAEMMGWEIDSNGLLIEDANAKPRHFALLGEVKGDQRNRRFVYYNCIASRSAEEHTTKEESIEPNTTTLTLSILPIEINGKLLVRGNIELNETNTSIYNGFFDTVVLPDAIPVTVDKTLLQKAIDFALSLDSENYTTESWAILEGALANAQAVAQNASSTQKQINDALNALNSAILQLEIA